MTGLALLVAIVASAPGPTIRDTPEARRACHGDVVRFCLPYTEPRAIWRCLKRNRDKLSPACAAYID